MWQNLLMPRESTTAKKIRTMKLITVFQRTYPNAHCELNFSNPLQLLVATILSAQCTDKRVNIVTAELFKKYCSAKDFADATLAELQEAVKTTGFFRNKAKNIKACCAALVEKFGGEVPRTMDELHALAGVGRKTANVVLGQRLRHQRRRGRGHACHAACQPAGVGERNQCGEDGTGVDEAGAAERLDAVQPLAHLARPPPLHRAQTGLCKLRNPESLSANRGEEV